MSASAPCSPTIMTSVPSATTWGSPTATKHALLIHGLTSSSHTWHRVASSLAAQGKNRSLYWFTALEVISLLGYCSQSRRAWVQSINGLPRQFHCERSPSIPRGKELFLDHRPFLGCIGDHGPLSHLPPSHPTAIILVEPPMAVAPETILFHEQLFSDSCVNIKPAEAYGAENLLWTREDNVYRELGTRLCSVDAVHGILSVRGRLCCPCLVGLVLIRIGLFPTAKPTVVLLRLLGRGCGEVESHGHGCRSCNQSAVLRPRYLPLPSRSTCHGPGRRALGPLRVSGSHRGGSFEEGS
jgi:hypothetical protein